MNCGCDGNGGLITDLQTGKHVHLGADGRHGPEFHDHQHGHQHSHRLQLIPQRSARKEVVRVDTDIFARNNGLAKQNRDWCAERHIVALNLMSSPGAGKTTLLERMIRDLGSTRELYVIEGDQATLRDAERIQAAGAKVIQINTGVGCHLDAGMVGQALRQLEPPRHSLVLIENVGNLVCPALFDLGEQARVVVASVTDGDDKPIKYPHMFRSADLILLNKIDLLPHVTFDRERFITCAREINPHVQILEISATRGDRLKEWYEWTLNLHNNAS